MIKNVVITTRPDFSIPFFMRSSAMEEALENMRAQGKFLTETRSLSDDGLTFTYEAVWESMEALKEWKEHPAVKEYAEQREAYNKENGITSQIQHMDYMDDKL